VVGDDLADAMPVMRLRKNEDNDFGVSALGELAFRPSWPVVHILAPAEDYLVPAVDFYWPADTASTAAVAAAHL
jgi:hypothetical protein